MRTLAISYLLLFSGSAIAVNYTSFVNLFIGTASGANGGSGGNAFPGAAIPHAMVKVRGIENFHGREILTYHSDAGWDRR